MKLKTKVWLMGDALTQRKRKSFLLQTAMVGGVGYGLLRLISGSKTGNKTEDKGDR